MKKEKKKLTLAIDPDILKKIDEGDFNRSKLINNLLKKYLKLKEK